MTETDKEIFKITAKHVVDYVFEKFGEFSDDKLSEKDFIKIQKMFNIITDNRINYGIEKTNSNR